MPYKANEARRHKIPRARYKVRNWPEYDRALQQRGSLTVWVTPEALAAWHPPRRGFGSLPTARRTLAGYEGMAMIRKGQVRNIGGGDMRASVTGLVVSIPREHGPGRQGLASVRSRRVAAA
jgi:hypothetical protein